MKKNSITVGIPFHFQTKPKEFILSVESILDQTYEPLKIHFIQDGLIGRELSEIIKKYLSKYENIVHIVLEKSNLATALNNSIKITDTEYYARMDSDDISMPNRLMLQYEFLEANKDIFILGSWAIEFEDDINDPDNFIKKVPSKYSEIIEFYHYRNPLIHPTVIFRKNIFNIIGYYNESFSSDQDLELWGRCIKSNIGISNIQQPLLYYNTNGIHIRRTKLKSIYNQILARNLVPANSLKLKFLKFIAICFRFMPKTITQYGYRKLR